MINLLWENIFKKNEQSEGFSTVLGQNKLFHNLSFKELQVVEDLVHKRHYRAGEPVFRQGETGIGMYIIAKGSVDISILEPDMDSPGEKYKEVFIAKLKRGDFFGEISLVEENGKRTAGAVAAEDSFLIGFFKPDLQVIVDNHPVIGVKIALNLSDTLAKRLKSTTDKVTQLRTELKSLSELQKLNENPEPTHHP